MGGQKFASHFVPRGYNDVVNSQRHYYFFLETKMATRNDGIRLGAFEEAKGGSV